MSETMDDETMTDLGRPLLGLAQMFDRLNMRPKMRMTSNPDPAPHPLLGHRTPQSMAIGILAMLVRARGLTLDVGRCPACWGGKWEWQTVTTMSRSLDAEKQGWTGGLWFPDLRRGLERPMVRPCPECSEPGPQVECFECEGSGGVEVVMPGPEFLEDVCPDCKGGGLVTGPPQPTGRDIRQPEQWVLDAVRPGDPAAREAASVIADQLQAQGDRLGEWLTLALVGKLDTAIDDLVKAGRALGSWPDDPPGVDAPSPRF